MTNVIANTIVQTVRDRFNFDVKMLPLGAQLGTEFLPTVTSYGLFRDDNWQYIGSPNNGKSKDYVPHQTDDVIALVEAASTVFDNNVVGVKCHWRDGHYVTIEPSRDFRRQIAGTDSVFPRMIVNAGYDGKPYNAALGTYREACKNLMMTRQVSGVSWSFRHDSGLRDKIDDLIADMSRFQGKWDELINHWNNLKEIQNVDIAEFMAAVMPPPKDDASQNVATRYLNRIRDMVTRLHRERSQLHGSMGDSRKANGWELYNAVQGYVQHDMTRRKRSGRPDPTAFDRMILAGDTADNGGKLVSKAETLLLQMA